MTQGTTRDPIQYVILLLLVANLVFSASLWLDRRPSEAVRTASTASALPAHATPEVLETFGRRVRDLYNGGDPAVFRDAFDDVFRVQFTLEQMTLQMQKIQAFAGRVDELAYSHHESRVDGGRNVYDLHYRARLSGGNFPTGWLTLSVVDHGDAFGLIGYHINAGSE